LQPAADIGKPHASSRLEFQLPSVLRTYLIWLFILAAVSALASDLYYHINRFQQCCTLAYDDPLFVDFWHYAYIFRYFHTITFFTGVERFAYPAFSAVIYDALYHLGSHAQAIFLTTELAVCTLAAILFCHKIHRIGLSVFPAAVLAASTLLLSYPLFFLFQAGNIEIIACVLTAAGLWAMLEGNDNTAAILWAAAGATKIYPLILLGLFLSRARWRSLAIGIAAFAIISVVSMAFVGPSIPIAFMGSIHGVGGFVSSYAGSARTQELPLDHSLLAPVKIFAYEMARRSGTLTYLTRPYILIVGTAALLTFFLRARHLPMANQILFFFAAMVALPPISYDYTLVHLYAPWAMLVVVALRTGATGKLLRGLRTAFVCFAVLFTSQRFLYYHWIHPNGTFKAIALVTLMVIALRYPIPDEMLIGGISLYPKDRSKLVE
jgi:hypothetical protein